MVVPCGPVLSWGLAVNLAVNHGAAELLPRTRSGESPCVTRAGLAGGQRPPAHPSASAWAYAGDRSLPIGECRHLVLGACSRRSWLAAVVSSPMVRGAWQQLGHWPPEQW